MTLKEIEGYKRDYLVPSQVAEVLGCDPHAIRLQARYDADKLGYPVIVMGSRTKIPRVAFLKFMCGAGAEGAKIEEDER